MLGWWSECGAELITWINQREEKADCIQTASFCITGATDLTAWWIEGMCGMCWKSLIFQFLSLPWSASCQSSTAGANLSWYSYSPACFLWDTLVVEISNWFPIAFLSLFPRGSLRATLDGCPACTRAFHVSAAGVASAGSCIFQPNPQLLKGVPVLI